MRKILCVTAFVISSNVFAFDTASYCRQVADFVGGSYQIEASCRLQEKEAQAKIYRKKAPSRVEKYCREVGEFAGGSYQIMNSCIDQELAAKASLR